MTFSLIHLIDEITGSKSTDPWYLRLAAYVLMWALMIVVALIFPLVWYWAMREKKQTPDYR